MPISNRLRRLKLPLLLVDTVVIAFGIAYLVQALAFVSGSRTNEPVGPAVFPLVFSILWVVGIAIITVFEIIKTQSVTDYEYKIDIRDVRIVRVVLALFLTAVYAFIVERTGYIITSVIYIICMMLSQGAVKRKLLFEGIIMAVITVCALYFSYTKIFHIPLPGQF